MLVYTCVCVCVYSNKEQKKYKKKLSEKIGLGRDQVTLPW